MTNDEKAKLDLIELIDIERTKLTSAAKHEVNDFKSATYKSARSILLRCLDEIVSLRYQVERLKAGYKAANEWCYDMEKAPRKGLFLACGKKEGIHITTWRLCNPSREQMSPHHKPYAWKRLDTPPPLPETE